MEILDEKYWTDRYEAGTTGWDIGYVSTPIKEYIDQLTDKDLRILIPGAGNAYEAQYLWEQGFRNVYVVDLSEAPLKNLAERVPGFAADQLLQQDFFEHQGQYDLIIEQTFFCALDPTLRAAYVQTCHELLVPGGKIAGLLFNIPLFTDHPPFGGHEQDYRPLFAPYFEIQVMETAHNSIKPRTGNELFIKLVKSVG